MELKKYKLSEVAKVEISSVDKKTKENETLVKLCNFTDVYHNWAITLELSDKFMMASANSNEIEKFSIKKGQVAFTKDSETRDDIGIPTYIADDFDNVLLGYHCALITPDESKVCGKYLNAFMHSAYIQKYFENSASGSGQRYTLSLETIEGMPLLLPSIEKQIIIGELFSSLDRKIALNRAINRNLEALAKQLYDYWFVQFDFPDENGRPYKSSGGKMVWNEVLKREIPEGWEVKRIGEVLGRVKSTPRLVTDEYLNEGKYPIIDQTRTIYYAGFTNREDAVLNQFPAVVFGDHSCAVKYVNFPFARGADGTQILIPNDEKVTSEYLYFVVQNVKLKEGYARHFSLLKDSAFVLPSITISKMYAEIVVPYFEQIKHNRHEIITLTHQRDELLPLLMNGQVTIG